MDVLLLLACRVAEPRVSLSCPALSFGRVLVGAHARAELQLVNDEALPLAFEVAVLPAGGGPAACQGKHAQPLIGSYACVSCTSGCLQLYITWGQNTSVCMACSDSTLSAIYTHGVCMGLLMHQGNDTLESEACPALHKRVRVPSTPARH